MASLPRLEATVRRLMGRVTSPAPASSTSAALWEYQREPSEAGRTAPLHDQRPISQPAPGLLSDEEVCRALRQFRFSPEFRGLRRVPIRALADLAGLSHPTIYAAMAPDLPTRPRRISETTRVKLSFVMRAINEGRLRFLRRGQIWEIEGSGGRIFEFPNRARHPRRGLP
jgi:hypothetical protein